MNTDAARADEQGFPNPAYAWFVVFIICLAGIFAFIDRIVVGLLTPAIQADLGLSDTQLGLLQGLAFAVFYTVFGLPLGWLADRWSRKWLLTIGISAWSLATALCGVARGFGGLFLARLGVGMGEGTVHPCGTSLISDYFPPRTRAMAFGVHVSGSAVGNGLTFVFGGMLLGWLTANGGLDVPAIGHAKPWQAMFILVGLGGLIPALLFVVFVREPMRREVANKGQSASWLQIRGFIWQNRRTLLCHHLGISLTSLTNYAFLNWMATFFLRVHEWEPARFSKTYGAYQVVFGILASFGAGWLASWLKGRGDEDANWRVALGGSVASITCAALAASVPSPDAAVLLYVAAGCFMAFPGVMGFATIAEFVPNEMRGFVTAVYYVFMGLLASGLGPLFVGLATDYVFLDKAAIDKSLLLVTLGVGIPAIILLTVGMRAYRESKTRAVWVTR